MDGFAHMTWECPCCNQKRTDSYIKVATHDISGLLGAETGTIFINCKYCADMPGCNEKAHDRKWVVNKFLGKNGEEKWLKNIE